MEEFNRLREEKEKIEDEIQAIVDELTSPGADGSPAPGLKEPVIDRDGYPRADIDVYNTRHKRHRYNCLQTDHQECMKKIEQLMPIIFEQQKNQRTTARPESTTQANTSVSSVNPVAEDTSVAAPSAPITMTSTENSLQPFALVRRVEAGSPAADAGLREGDQILQFGSANATNHRQLLAIRDIVQHHIDAIIPVRIRRSDVHEMLLELKPAREWPGDEPSTSIPPTRGVLGCHIVPL